LGNYSISDYNVLVLGLNDVREEARLFWEQAVEDLKTAKVLLDNNRFYAAAFFSHQAAEKALKALYIETKREIPPRTHSLIRLVRELGISEEEIVDAAIDLTPEYIVARYPDAANEVPAKTYNRRIAEECFLRAKKVIKYCAKRLRIELPKC